MVAAGVGAAMNGMRPVVDLNFIDFAFGAMDEIANQAAKIRYMLNIPVPIVIRASGGVALYGAQHTNSLEAWFAHLPGLLVATPATPADVYGLMKSALHGDDPVIFMMHKRLSFMKGEVPDTDYSRPFGAGSIVRHGANVTLVSYSYMVHPCLQTAEKLASEGIDVEVIDLRTVYPLDVDLVLQSVKKTGRLLFVSDAPLLGGIGAELVAAVQQLGFEYLDAPMRRLGAKHSPIPNSPPLIDALIPQTTQIEQELRELVNTSV
jgi:pyruvate/2-oxoglutarate/acetoin dehydrogenase E1 component